MEAGLAGCDRRHISHQDPAGAISYAEELSLRLEILELQRGIDNGAMSTRLGSIDRNLARIAEDKNKISDPEVFFPFLSGILTVLAGFALAAYTTRLSAKVAGDARMETHLLDALKWFEGQTQKRSVGLAVIEANWDRTSLLHRTWTSVLVAQAVYLLSYSNEGDRPDEIHNLERIYNLLTRAQLRVEERSSLSAAIKGRAAGHIGLTFGRNERAHRLKWWKLAGNDEMNFPGP